MPIMEHYFYGHVLLQSVQRQARDVSLVAVIPKKELLHWVSRWLIGFSLKSYFDIIQTCKKNCNIVPKNSLKPFTDNLQMLTFDHICFGIVSFSVYQYMYLYVDNYGLFFDLFKIKLQTWCFLSPKYFMVYVFKKHIFWHYCSIFIKKLTLIQFYYPI